MSSDVMRISLHLSHLSVQRRPQTALRSRLSLHRRPLCLAASMGQDRVLYWGSGSPSCWRVMSAFEYKGITYEGKMLDMFKQEHKCDEVKALNPREQLPTFKDGDAIVNESCGILMYLESQYPEKPLLPSDPVTKARVLQRMFETIVLEGPVAEFAVPKMFGKDFPNEEEVANKIKAELALWESYAGKYEFIASDEFTLADAAFGTFLLSMIRFGATLKEYPNLKKYTDMLKDYPPVQKTTPPHWAMVEETFNFMNII